MSYLPLYNTNILKKIAPADSPMFKRTLQRPGTFVNPDFIKSVISVEIDRYNFSLVLQFPQLLDWENISGLHDDYLERGGDSAVWLKETLSKVENPDYRHNLMVLLSKVKPKKKPGIVWEMENFNESLAKTAKTYSIPITSPFEKTISKQPKGRMKALQLYINDSPAPYNKTKLYQYYRDWKNHFEQGKSMPIGKQSVNKFLKQLTHQQFKKLTGKDNR